MVERRIDYREIAHWNYQGAPFPVSHGERIVIVNIPAGAPAAQLLISQHLHPIKTDDGSGT